jgi:hypothetical protein
MAITDVTHTVRETSARKFHDHTPYAWSTLTFISDHHQTLAASVYTGMLLGRDVWAPVPTVHLCHLIASADSSPSENRRRSENGVATHVALGRSSSVSTRRPCCDATLSDMCIEYTDGYVFTSEKEVSVFNHDRDTAPYHPRMCVAYTHVLGVLLAWTR